MRQKRGSLIPAMPNAPHTSPKPAARVPGDPPFDPTTLRRLVDLARTDAAPLLRQLAADLGTERDRLIAGAQEADLPGLHRAAHGIVALAGTAGDVALADLARSLQDAAGGPAPVEPTLRLARRVAAWVERLIAAVAAEGRRCACGGPAQ